MHSATTNNASDRMKRAELAIRAAYGPRVASRGDPGGTGGHHKWRLVSMTIDRKKAA